MRSSFVLMLGGLPGLAESSPAVTLRQLYQFPNATFIENIAIRPNGHLLLNTLFNQGRMYTLDPYAENPEPRVVAALPDADGLTGIAEISHDVYIVSGGKNGANYNFLNGTARIAKINLNGCEEGKAEFEDVASIPDAQILNGMVGLPRKPHVVLSVDSITGTLYRIDSISGAVDVAWQSTKLGPGDNTDIVPLGANGLNIYNGYLYFTNSAQQFFGRIEINRDGSLTGEFEKIYQMPAGSTNAYDDFDMTRHGVSYVCSQQDSLVKITASGNVKTIIGPDSGVKLYSPTSVALNHKGDMAFIVTGGIEGQGGQVIALKL